MNVKIGVLSYQGSVVEHVEMLNKISGVKAIEVKTLPSLNEVDGVVLPGGESTTIGKLMKHFGLYEPLLGRIKTGMPVYGTCAGLIMLAKDVQNEQGHLKVMDIEVRRNAYGRQLDSFECNVSIPEFSAAKVPLVFIRAPWIASAGKDVRILCQIEGHIVAARQNNMLVTSFHPELTNNLAVHAYFANMVKNHKESMIK